MAVMLMNVKRNKCLGNKYNDIADWILTIIKKLIY